jgi:hypothetical protein
MKDQVLVKHFCWTANFMEKMERYDDHNDSLLSPEAMRDQNMIAWDKDLDSVCVLN